MQFQRDTAGVQEFMATGEQFAHFAQRIFNLLAAVDYMAPRLPRLNEFERPTIAFGLCFAEGEDWQVG